MSAVGPQSAAQALLSNSSRELHTHVPMHGLNLCQERGTALRLLAVSRAIQSQAFAALDQHNADFLDEFVVYSLQVGQHGDRVRAHLSFMHVSQSLADGALLKLACRHVQNGLKTWRKQTATRYSKETQHPVESQLLLLL